jgi:large subunit ribosomal protein L4
MELPLRNVTGGVAGTVELNDAVFGQPMNGALLHQALVMYQLNKRQGTHSVKTRGQVSGGGAKPWAQKGTGRARQGSTRSPQWRHGGVVFGPHPRDHRREMPKRMRHQALKCVLSEKARGGRLILLDDLTLSLPRTKVMVQVLKDLGVSGSALIITRDPYQNLIRSAGNIKKVWTLPVGLLNAYELLKRETVVMTLAAARRAEEIWVAETSRKRSRLVSTLDDAVADQVLDSTLTQGVEEAPDDMSGEVAPNGDKVVRSEKMPTEKRPHRKPKSSSP